MSANSFDEIDALAISNRKSTLEALLFILSAHSWKSHDDHNIS